MGPRVTVNDSARIQAWVCDSHVHAVLQSIQNACHTSAETASRHSFISQEFTECLAQARPSSPCWAVTGKADCQSCHYGQLQRGINIIVRTVICGKIDFSLYYGGFSFMGLLTSANAKAFSIKHSSKHILLKY